MVVVLVVVMMMMMMMKILRQTAVIVGLIKLAEWYSIAIIFPNVDV